MSEPYHSIGQKLESALASLVGTLSVGQLDGATITKGTDDEDKEMPRHVCFAEEEETSRIFGNSFLRGGVRTETNANDETEAEHAARHACVRDLFFFNTLQANLNAQGVTDFTVIGIDDKIEISSGRDGDHWFSEVKVRMLCAPSTIS